MANLSLLGIAEAALLELKQLEPLFTADPSQSKLFKHISSLSAHQLLGFLIAVPLGRSKQEFAKTAGELSSIVIDTFLSSGSFGWLTGVIGNIAWQNLAFDAVDTLLPLDLQEALVVWFARHQRIVLSQAGL